MMTNKNNYDNNNNVCLQKYGHKNAIIAHIPVVHVQEETGCRIVQLISEHLLQLTHQLVVICGAHTAELVQQKLFDIASWWLGWRCPLTRILINIHFDVFTVSNMDDELMLICFVFVDFSNGN